MTQPLHRITQLDGVRAIAILLVFVNHVFKVKLAWAGVDLFFVLSGFLITGLLLAAKQRRAGDYFGHFYRRRARRILPPYLLLLAITPVFFGFAWLRFGYLYVFLMNFVPAFTLPHLSSLDVLWSLALEEQFYLFWPVLIFLLTETAIAWLAGSLLVLAPILRFVATPWFSNYAPVYMLLPFRMDLLAAGALLAVSWRHRRAWIERFGGCGLSFVPAALLGLWMLSRHPNFSISANTPFANLWIYEMTLLGSVGIVLWTLSGRWVQVLEWSWVRALGRVSYSFYLIHTTVLIVLQRSLANRWLLAGLTLGLSLVYAAISWRYLERPLLYGSRSTEAQSDEDIVRGLCTRE